MDICSQPLARLAIGVFHPGPRCNLYVCSRACPTTLVWTICALCATVATLVLAPSTLHLCRYVRFAFMVSDLPGFSFSAAKPLFLINASIVIYISVSRAPCRSIDTCQDSLLLPDASSQVVTELQRLQEVRRSSGVTTGTHEKSQAWVRMHMSLAEKSQSLQLLCQTP